MKKTKAITLVLVTGLLGCSHPHQQPSRLYLRTDTGGYYTPVATGYHGYYAFRPFGTYYGGQYVRQGYSNDAVHVAESSVTRGGFGETGGFHVSS